MTKKDRYFVYGATGTQGGAVARLLVQQGFEVRTLTRKQESVEALNQQGIEGVIGDLADIQSLHQAHEGVTKVFLNLPVEFNADTLKTYTQNAIEAALQAGVELFVVNTSICVPASVTSSAGIEIKRELADTVAKSGLPFIIVKPIVYLENFLIPGVLNDGTLAYPVPADQPISWISTEDAAQYHVYALTHPELAGSSLDAPGSENLTGTQVAERFSQVLGTQVNFFPLPFDAFEAGIKPFLGEETAAGLKGMYEWMYANTDQLAVYDQVSDEVKSGLKLRSLDEWIEQMFAKK